MTHEKLRHEIRDGVVFWGVDEGGALQAVMGVQDVLDVTLIRHAYVRTSKRRARVGQQATSPSSVADEAPGSHRHLG